jgi:hypothetical protein
MAVVDNDGDGVQGQLRTTTAEDDEGLQDQARGYDGEGREWVARDGKDSGVMMIAVAKMPAAEDSGGG